MVVITGLVGFEMGRSSPFKGLTKKFRIFGRADAAEMKNAA